MNKTILLVEDEENDIFLMQRALKQAGVENPLEVARDGQEAIDCLQGVGEYADRERPCLVLLDLKLPHVMGLEVLRWIRQQHELQTLPVIIVTSSQLAPDIDAAYRLGANSYLTKASKPEDLLKMVIRIKEYWLELNQPAPNSAEMAAYT